MIIEGKKFIDSKEAAALLGRSPSHIRALSRSGRVPCRKLLGRWLYDYEALLVLAGVKTENNENTEVLEGLEGSEGEGAQIDERSGLDL
jgi:hypothetical protein